jgi:hypothetical protein
LKQVAWVKLPIPINYLLTGTEIIDLLDLAYWMNHIIVNVGMKSIPGINSSIKLNIPPKNPFLNPNILQNIKADMGAQIISPKKGTNITALPIISITIHAPREGKGLEAMGW